MLDQEADGPQPDRRVSGPIQCDDCTIQIGEGYQEAVPFEFVDDSSPHPRVMRVCWRCWESLNRRRLKRLAEERLHGANVFRAG